MDAIAGLFIVALAAGLQPGGEGHVTTPGVLEGRPTARATSALQALVDRAAPGEVLEIPPGIYDGDLYIDKRITLIGRGRPLLRGSGDGSVVRIRAADVVVEGFDIDGRGGGDLGRDSSGVHVAAHRATIRDCRITNALFGIYLRQANDSAVEYCTISGIPGKDPGEKGSGIHAYDMVGFRFVGNEIVDARDAIYMQNASGGVIRGNRARDMRYGLHYMFSDDNAFEDNVFENGAAGSAIMYSERIVFRRNQFLRNRGFASVGLLLQQCDDVLAEDNLIADNARGIFIEGTYRNVFRRNLVAKSDVAIYAFDSAKATRFEGNSFVGNMTPLLLVGKRTDTVFDGNYWSSHDQPDLDGDGRSDRPYRLTSVFDHMRGNLTAADLYADSFAGAALGVAERTFPVLAPIPLVEASPLARPPALPQVPRPARAASERAHAPLAASAVALAVGTLVLTGGRRERRRFGRKAR